MTADPADPIDPAVSTAADRLPALLGAAASAGDELAELDAIIRRLRLADPAAGASIDPVASWRRLESFLDDR